jgi:RNA polymerase sigma-70 factor (ECF subfamily)
MIFMVCDPAISDRAQIGLALQILCGFGIDEIADAFLTKRETIIKRLYRAKTKLRKQNIQFIDLNDGKIKDRMDNVLTTLYLLFNRGYHPSVEDKTNSKELCLEAMRLCHLLLGDTRTDAPKVNALMALMCFHASRFDARFDDANFVSMYEEQDRDKWDKKLIEMGNIHLIKSAKGQELSKYHLEASIAYWHCTENDLMTKWEHILNLYNQHLQIEPSPMVAMNRIFAFAKVYGKKEAIKASLDLKKEDDPYHFSLLGYLYAEIDTKKSIEYYHRAIGLAKSKKDKSILQKKIRALL